MKRRWASGFSGFGGISERSAPETRCVPRRQQLADQLDGLGRIERQERHRGFGPQHEVDAGGAILDAGRVVLREIEVEVEDAALMGRHPFFPLQHARLYQADARRVRCHRSRLRKAPVAVGHQDRDRRNQHRAAAPPRARGAAIDPRHQRCRQHEHRDEAQAVDADQARRLHEAQRIGQRVADDVPWKPGEDVSAQPFRDGERQGERQHAAKTGPPRERRHCGRRRPE